MFSTRPTPELPGPGQESAWDYPRPPALEPVTARLTVVLGGVTIADTTRGYRVLETSHPPNYYFPPDDVVDGALEPAKGASFCEWKGRAHYFTVRGGGAVVHEAAWGYDEPSPAFEPIRGYVAFYASRVDQCTVDGEVVTPQPGGFYGGWITSTVVGPFKGGPGSRGW
ncbi:MAG TPA: DUF427 domain-containing protein [Acidimicrobiia bacterium]|nr:DUF427 domain-containing protein [Acidimicrobiia bacterium]